MSISQTIPRESLLTLMQNSYSAGGVAQFDEEGHFISTLESTNLGPTLVTPVHRSNLRNFKRHEVSPIQSQSQSQSYDRFNVRTQ